MQQSKQKEILKLSYLSKELFLYVVKFLCRGYVYAAHKAYLHRLYVQCRTLVIILHIFGDHSHRICC